LYQQQDHFVIHSTGNLVLIISPLAMMVLGKKREIVLRVIFKGFLAWKESVGCNVKKNKNKMIEII